MKIIEQFICGKKGDPGLCEDVIVTTTDFMAVIDGATSKTCPKLAGMSGGRFAAQVAADTIRALAADIDGHSTINQITQRLRTATASYMDVDAVGEKPACCLAIYSRARREIWRVGDIGILQDGAESFLPKSIDDVTSSARAAMIEALLREGETVGSLQADDKGRQFIFPLLQRQHLFANRADAGNFGFGVMNGDTVPDKFVDVIPAAGAQEIVLASDGYPFLFATLAQSEEKLAHVLRDDPLLYKIHRSTKGMQAGQVSFDDRSYLRFSV